MTAVQVAQELHTRLGQPVRQSDTWFLNVFGVSDTGMLYICIGCVSTGKGHLNYSTIPADMLERHQSAYRQIPRLSPDYGSSLALIDHDHVLSCESGMGGWGSSAQPQNNQSVKSASLVSRQQLGIRGQGRLAT
jgi:hypothetical protein